MAEVTVRLSADQRAARVRSVEAEDYSDGRGLAGSIRADETGHSSGQNGEVHAVESQRRAEVFVHALHFNGCVVHVVALFIVVSVG